jgi:hypothetical protein
MAVQLCKYTKKFTELYTLNLQLCDVWIKIQ